MTKFTAPLISSIGIISAAWHVWGEKGASFAFAIVCSLLTIAITIDTNWSD